MKKALLLLFFCIYNINAQTPTFDWGHLIGGTMNMYVYDNATDANGNVYMTGEYSGTVDFDPGAGTQNQTATASGGRDIFILKLNADGTFGWVKTYGGTGVDFGQRITVDNLDNVYVGGRFQNSVTFTGYGGFASNGGYDGFLLKLNAAGTIQWVVDVAGGGTEGFLGITTDSSGNIYTTGFFDTATTALLGLNSTSTAFTRSGSSTNYDFFVAKYNTSGEILWSNKTGAGYDEISYDIALTDDNKVVIVGDFKGTGVDFNPGAASFTLFSNSNSTSTGFMQVLNGSTGVFEWARSLGSSTNDSVSSVTTSNNNIYVTGYFSGSQGDFNTTGSGGGDVINKSGAIDSFIAKYSSTSNFLWVKGIRGITGADVRGVNLASKGNPENIYATGTYTSGVYLDPASNTQTGGFGGKDVFVLSLNDAGLYQWGGRMVSMSNDDVGGLSIDNNYNIYMSGYVANDNFSINPIVSQPVTPRIDTTGNDLFIAKLSQPNACIVNIPDANFKNYLVNNSAINTNSDTEIQCSEAAAFTGTINCSNMSISSLTGIEAFINLTSLICYTNPLGSLNVSQNGALTNLDCNSNQLTTIDLSNNSALTSLRIMFNSLTTINVSQNSALLYLDVGYNSLSVIDVSNNSSLVFLGCYNNLIENINVSTNLNLRNIACYSNNQLNSLNIANSNNSNFTGMNAFTCPNLTCIQIDNSFTPPSNGSWVKDATASYNTNCNLNTNGFTHDNSFSMYPNPVENELNIQNTLNKSIDKIQIMDITGKVVKNIIRTSETINISELKAGFYMVMIYSENQIYTSKIIKK
jgi:hypothetical protein